MTRASRASGIQWPPARSKRAASLITLVERMERNQWQSPQAILAGQLRDAQKLLRHAAATVPFYRERLAEADVDAAAPLDWNAWHRVPVLRRRDLQAAGDRLLSTAPPPGHGRGHQGQSSGSSGTPIVTWRTEWTQLLWDAVTLREHLWHRRDLSGTLVAIRHFPPGVADYPAGRKGARWGRASGSVFETGPTDALTVVTDIDRQVDWLRHRSPDYLLSYPSNVEALLRRCARTGLRFPRLRQVMTVSEIVRPDLRDLVRRHWGVEIKDVYSADETGYIALQHPADETYLVQADTVLVEVVDEAGHAVAPGEVGRVLVTTLHNYLMPLVRYELGDMAERGGPAPCGRGLPVLNRIIGRVRNVVTLPDGRRRWIVPGSHRYTEIGPVEQYQIVQHSVHDIEMRLAVAAPLTAAQEAALADAVRDALGHAFPVRFTYLDEIPRGPGGKYEDVVSKVTA